MQSGGDTVLQGAVIEGKTVGTDIGGDLIIESLQDTSSFTHDSKSSGFSASVAVIGAGGGGSVSASRTGIDSNYASKAASARVTAAIR